MDGNPVIEVAIALMLMYLLLSILCTTLNEYIATFIGMRANTLQQSITKLVDAPNLLTSFYNHGMVRSAFPEEGKHPSYLSGDTFAQGLLGSLDPSKPLAGFADVQAAILQLPHSDVRDVLLSSVSAADQDMTKLRNNLATWFDSAMDRVSGLYKRKLKIISLVVGIGLALAVNADSVAVAKSLWKNASQRQEITSMATNMFTNGCKPGDADDCLKTLDANAAVQDLETFPIGWNDSNLRADGPFVKLLGILFTGFALSLGAPFWFDLLGKFVNIRGNGARPERTQALPPQPNA